MRSGRMPAWLVLLLIGLGLVLLIPALWVIVSVTARPLHRNPESVPTVMHGTPPPKWAGAVEQARRIVRAGVAEQNLPGASVAVGIDGDIVWVEGFGFADLKSSTPVTPDHRFRIGTASTALTSAAAGLLLENGRLKLDDEIQAYTPAFPRKQWPVTLRGLMGHTAGLSPDGGDGRPLFTRHCERPADALPYFANDSLLFQPGTQHRFSSDGWILVSTAVEAAANQPFLSYMRERIFDPLGMRDTVADGAPESDDDFPLVNLVLELIHDPRATRSANPDTTRRPAQDRVTPYFTRFAKDPNYGMHVMRPLDYSCYSGASVFVSTPSDLARFGMALQGGKLLKPATVELLQTSQRLASGVETDYGLGWRIRTVNLAGKPTRVVGHDGDSMGGMVSSLITFPDYGMVVALTSNISYADTFALGVRIAEIYAQRK